MTEPFSVERDENGFAKTIMENGRVVLWLHCGATRNEEEVNRLVALLNLHTSITNSPGLFQID